MNSDPVSLGRAAEERGFESLTFPEHTHIPASLDHLSGGRFLLPPKGPDEVLPKMDQYAQLNS